MKRLSSSDSLGALISICPNSTDEHIQSNHPMYTREFQTMLEGFDEEGCVEESGHVTEKKRRLGVDQVKALEKNFEVENKLEPERKVKLAQELGLQPRQVAVWFQNRRARWKTKQLERDYGVLKANYDGLKTNFDKLQHDNESLLKEIRELKSKLNEEEEEQKSEKTKLETPQNSMDKSEEDNLRVMESATVFGEFKDGSSDSDSSAILNEDNNSCSIIHQTQHEFIINGNTNLQKSYQPQLVKIEEHNFLGEFFSDDQAPTLHWYGSDVWN